MMRNPKMTPERWKQVDQVLNATYELQPHEISGFLDQACSGDRELRQHVERLLAADNRAKSFIESGVLDAATHADTEALIPSLTGTREAESQFSARSLLADRYQLVAKLGKGGMG